MKFVPNAVSAKVARQILLTQKNSPAILFSAGIVGMVATTVLACKATLKVEEVLDETQEKLKMVEEVAEKRPADYSETDAKKDKAYIYIRTGVALGKLYGPSVLLGVASVTALAGSHNILTKRNAALTMAYGALDKAFKEYRGRVMHEVGEDRERELYYELTPCEIDDEETGKKKTVKEVGPNRSSIYARLFDDRSSSWSKEPEYNLLFLRCQQNFANDQLQSRGHVFLNEVYDMLGIERSKAGAVVGWVKGQGDDYIDFGVFDRAMTQERLDFFTGREGAIWLDFNVDGVIYDKI